VALAPATKVHVALLKVRIANSIPTRTSLALCSLGLRLPGNCHLRQVYPPRAAPDLATFGELFRVRFELQKKIPGALTQSTTAIDLTAQHFERKCDVFHQRLVKVFYVEPAEVCEEREEREINRIQYELTVLVDVATDQQCDDSPRVPTEH